MRNNSNYNNTITMNMNEEEGKMKKIMKTGIIAAGTVAAGLAFGTSPVTAFAAEVDANNAAVQTNAETAVPETSAEAKKAVDNAQANVEKTDTAVKEAQTKVEEAQQDADAASSSADVARAEAEEAFDDAKSKAAEEDAAAQETIEAAERVVDEADVKVRQTGEDVASAKESVEEAENSADEAVAESDVTENDITEKESELEDAQSALSDAVADLEASEAVRNNAVAAADEAESVRSSAEGSVREAGAEKAAADAAVSAAGEAAGKATEDLQTAEELKSGTRDIKDTEQYKEEQKAKEMMDNAAEKAGTAARDTDAAAEDLANAEAAVDAAEQELGSAVEDLNSKETALSEAGQTKEAADKAKEEAQNTYDNASADAADADAAVSEASNTVTEAKEGLKTAETAKDDADNAVKKATDDVDTARYDAEAVISADIANAEKEAAEKKTAVESAKETLEAAAEKFKQGTLGLIDWMLAKKGLTKDQTQDLTSAREVLINAAEEDFSKWYGGKNTGLPEERNGKVVVIGDEKDATTLDNLQRSIEIMKKINELRATDDNYTGDLQRNDSYTNFYFMATAEAGAMRGAGLMRHSYLTTSCEDLAFGYTDPTVGWYNEEKAIFDRIKGELGITKITSMADVSRIEKEADNQDVVVGHYTNLFWAADQVMGVGYTQYRETYCYNASKTSNYTNDQYNRAMHMYTVEEFEQLATEYYRSVNKPACEDALEKAIAEQSGAEERLQSLKDGKDSAVERAIQKAKAELVSKVKDAEQAAKNLNDAKQVLASAEKAFEDAGTRKASADQVLQEAARLLNKAIEDSHAADTDCTFAEKSRDEAKRAVFNAETALKEAINGKTSIASVLKEKYAKLTEANAALDDAVSAHKAAAKRLADLTSDKTLDLLREQKRLADEALRSVLDIQSDKGKALKQAEAVLAKAESDASAAKNALQEAKDRFAEAALARDAAQNAADQAAEELAALREQYAPVLLAIAARDAAREELNLAEAAFNDAESNLVKAQEDLEQAQLNKAITADKLLRATGLSVDDALKADIEDPDFAYLNDYISAIRAADSILSEARTALAAANAELDARKSDSDNAKRAYLAAVADLLIVQDRERMYQLDSNPGHTSGSSVESVDLKEITSSATKETDFDSAERKASTDTTSPVLTKAEHESSVYNTEPVATGDTSNVMALMTELLAGAGLLAVVFKKRKEAKGKRNQ